MSYDAAQYISTAHLIIAKRVESVDLGRFMENLRANQFDFMPERFTNLRSKTKHTRTIPKLAEG